LKEESFSLTKEADFIAVRKTRNREIKRESKSENDNKKTRTQAKLLVCQKQDRLAVFSNSLELATGIVVWFERIGRTHRHSHKASSQASPKGDKEIEP
jgi:hypothetical protein